MDKLIDLHNHSNNSEDSRATLNEMCLGAIDKNIDIIAFTEHIDNNPSDTGYKFFNEKKYSLEIKKIQKRYSESLQILKGAEFDAPHLYTEEFEIITNGDYDVILGSVHLIGDKFIGDVSILERYSLEVLFQKYYEQLLALVQFGGFDVLAHFDFPKRYYKKSYGKENLINEILKTMIKQNIALEINTSPLRKGYHESSPGKEIVSKYASFGGQMVTIGSDAHTPEDIGADFDYVYNLIQSIGGLKTGYFEKREFKL